MWLDSERSTQPRDGQHSCPGCGCVFFSGNLGGMVSGRLCGLCSSRVDRRRAGLEGMAGNMTETLWRGKLKPTTQTVSAAWGDKAGCAPGVPRTGLGAFNPAVMARRERLSQDRQRMGFVDRGLGRHTHTHHHGGTAVAAREAPPGQAAGNTARSQQKEKEVPSDRVARSATPLTPAASPDTIRAQKQRRRQVQRERRHREKEQRGEATQNGRVGSSSVPAAAAAAPAAQDRKSHHRDGHAGAGGQMDDVSRGSRSIHRDARLQLRRAERDARRRWRGRTHTAPHPQHSV